MRRTALISFLFLLLAGSATAQEIPTGELVEGLSCASDPTQTYTLYFPSYLKADQKWPVLFVLDPRGRSKMAAEIFKPAAEKYGWILISSNDTRSDTSNDPNIKALNALAREVVRYPVDPKRGYMAGFSGTAIFSVAVALGGGVTGVIGVGGRFIEDWKGQPVPFSHWGAAGSTDFNYSQMQMVDEFLEEAGAPHRFEMFSGSHQWMPPVFAEEAVSWMELDAMRRELRPRDLEMIERLWESDAARARELESEGSLVDALHRWRGIEGTFAGLREVEEATLRVKVLEKDKKVRKELRSRRKWDDYEQQMRRQMGIAVGTMRNETRPIPIGRLLGELRVDELNKHAAAGGYEALAAQRVLSSMYTQMSFYLMRDFLSRQDYVRAALVLEVAEELRPGSSFVQYNLACALARAGEKKKAMNALERSIEFGFANADLMRDDDDLASLRDEKEFQALLGKLDSSR